MVERSQDISQAKAPDTASGTRGKLGNSRSMLSRLVERSRRPFGELFKTSSLLMCSRLFGAALGFVSQLALARLLGAESLGIYYLAVSLAGVLAILGGLGYPSITVRFVSEYRVKGEWRALRAFLSSAYRTAMMTCAALLLVAWIILYAWPTTSPELKWALTIGVIMAPAIALVRLNSSIANAYRRFFLSFLPDLLVRPAVMLAVLVVLISIGVTISVPHLLALNLAIVILTAVPVYLIVRRTTNADLEQPELAELAAMPANATGSNWRRHGLPMIVVALFLSLFADVAILSVGIGLPPDQTATFGVSIKMALLLGFVIQTTHQLVLPDAAEAYARNDLAAVQSVIGRGNFLSVAACCGAIGVFWLLGDKILMVFGEEFAKGHMCLVILALSQAYRAALGPASQMLNLAGMEYKTLPVFTVCLVSMPLLSIGLVPSLGLNGAAVAVLLVTMVWTTWLAILVKKVTGVQTSVLALVTGSKLADDITDPPSSRQAAET